MHFAGDLTDSSSKMVGIPFTDSVIDNWKIPRFVKKDL